MSSLRSLAAANTPSYQLPAAFAGRIHQSHISLEEARAAAQLALPLFSPPRAVFTGEYRIPLRTRRALRRFGERWFSGEMAASPEELPRSELTPPASFAHSHAENICHIGDGRAQATIKLSREFGKEMRDPLRLPVPQTTEQVSSGPNTPAPSSSRSHQVRFERNRFQRQITEAWIGTVSQTESDLLPSLPSTMSSFHPEVFPLSFSSRCGCSECLANSSFYQRPRQETDMERPILSSPEVGLNDRLLDEQIPTPPIGLARSLFGTFQGSPDSRSPSTCLLSEDDFKPNSEESPHLQTRPLPTLHPSLGTSFPICSHRAILDTDTAASKSNLPPPVPPRHPLHRTVRSQHTQVFSKPIFNAESDIYSPAPLVRLPIICRATQVFSKPQYDLGSESSLAPIVHFPPIDRDPASRSSGMPVSPTSTATSSSEFGRLIYSPASDESSLVSPWTISSSDSSSLFAWTDSLSDSPEEARSILSPPNLPLEPQWAKFFTKSPDMIQEGTLSSALNSAFSSVAPTPSHDMTKTKPQADLTKIFSVHHVEHSSIIHRPVPKRSTEHKSKPSEPILFPAESEAKHRHEVSKSPSAPPDLLELSSRGVPAVCCSSSEFPHDPFPVYAIAPRPESPSTPKARLISLVPSPEPQGRLALAFRRRNLRFRPIKISKTPNIARAIRDETGPPFPSPRSFTIPTQSQLPEYVQTQSPTPCRASSRPGLNIDCTSSRAQMPAWFINPTEADLGHDSNVSIAWRRGRPMPSLWRIPDVVDHTRRAVRGYANDPKSPTSDSACCGTIRRHLFPTSRSPNPGTPLSDSPTLGRMSLAQELSGAILTCSGAVPTCAKACGKQGAQRWFQNPEGIGRVCLECVKQATNQDSPRNAPSTSADDQWFADWQDGR